MLPKPPPSTRLVAAAALLFGLLPSCGGDETSTQAAAGFSVSAIEPASVSARGGETVTIRGSGFASDATLRFGLVSAALTVVSDTEATAKTPPLFAGLADVVIENPGGAEATLGAGLAVLPLELSFIEGSSVALPPLELGVIAAAATSDLDGDGDTDVFLGMEGVQRRYLENDGNGNFTERVIGSPLDGFLSTRAVLAADFDGDGDDDVFAGGAGADHVLYRNDGAGGFELVANVIDDPDEVSAAMAVDVDQDGDLDLVVGGEKGQGSALRVFLNDAGGASLRFSLAKDGDFPSIDASVTAMTSADFDGDERVDLLFATDDGALSLIRGASQAAADSVLSLADVAAHLSAGDVDGDGALDVVLVGPGQDRLLLNDGAGHFFDDTVRAMPLDASVGVSAALVDLDRDQSLDLVVANALAQTRLYRNDGGGRFLDVTPVLPMQSADSAFVGAFDLDGDADVDVVLLDRSPPSHLYFSVPPSPYDAAP